jgi:hypothetical protein
MNPRIAVAALVANLILLPAARAVAQPTPLGQELSGTVGTRYVEAKRLADQGDLNGAAARLRGLLAEVGDAEPAEAINHRLAQVEARLKGAPEPARKDAVALRAEIELEEGQKRQKRVYRWALPPGQADKKTVRVQMDRLAVDLDLEVKPAGEITAKGSFETPKARKLFAFPPAKLDPAASFNEVVRLREGRAQVKVHLQAGKAAEGQLLIRVQGASSARKETRLRMVLVFREAPLKEVLERVAEVGGWRLELGSGVDPARLVELRVEATSQEGLRKKVCEQLRLTCAVAGETLRVTPQP